MNLVVVSKDPDYDSASVESLLDAHRVDTLNELIQYLGKSSIRDFTRWHMELFAVATDEELDEHGIPELILRRLDESHMRELLAGAYPQLPMKLKKVVGIASFINYWIKHRNDLVGISSI